MSPTRRPPTANPSADELQRELSAARLDKTRLLGEAKDALERQTAVSEVLAAIGRSGSDVQPVFDLAVALAGRLCDANGGILWLRDGDVFRYTAGWSDEGRNLEALASYYRQRPWPLTGTGVTGRVYRTGAVVLIPDVTVEPDFPKESLQVQPNVRTVLGVPLIKHDAAIGVITLVRRTVRPFSDHDIALVRTFADQAVLALENARLLNETKEALEQQTATREVLEAISAAAFDLDAVFKTIVQSAVHLCRADNASLVRVEGGRNRQVAHAGPGLEAYERYVRDRPGSPAGRGTLAGRVLLEGRSLQIEDVLTDPEYDTQQFADLTSAGVLIDQPHSMLGVPIIQGEEIVGIIIARRSEVRRFDDREIAILETFGQQAAIAIENVRLFNETKEALDQQIAMGEVLKAISQAKSDIQPVFDAINKHAARLCHATLSGIFRVEGEDLPVMATSRDAAQALVDVLGRKPPRIDRSSAVGRAVMERRTIHLLDVLADPEYRVDMREAGGYRTVLAVPLLRDGVPIGALSLVRLEVRPFTDREIQLVETFADQAVIAIENVRLLQAVERQRQELTRFVSPQVASLLTSDEGQRLLEGHRRAITVLFCDLRGFSAFSETAEPEEVLSVLREYHAAMGELIVAHGGTLEHFAGDGMMVFFNDPVPVTDHELRAVRLAVAMRGSFDAMAQAWRRKGYELGFGIGAAVGHATLGRIGFEGRYDYGAIGNAVIVASRLSGEAKAGQILLTQRLHAAVEQHVDAEAIGELSLKGQTRPTAAFNVMALRAPE